MPSHLDELKPKYLDMLPIDPFDGASLRYRFDDAEYVVYSVGENGVDDGGLSETANRPDVVVRVKLKETGGASAE